MKTIHRKEPGSTGEGQYFHIIVRPKEELTLFNTRDVGRPGHSLLVLGKSKEGKWLTHKWLINKNDAYINPEGKLQSDDFKVQRILDYCDGCLVHKEKDIFEVRSHPSPRKQGSVRAESPSDRCSEMYFDNYDEYDRFFSEQLLTKK